MTGMSVLHTDRARLAYLGIGTQLIDLMQPNATCASDALAQTRLGSSTYPVLTLPSEIISEIFVHFLPPYPDCPPLKGNESPTCLTQICHKWREIALATPTLWRAIPTSVFFFQRRRHIVDLWVKRSRCCPLSIQIQNFNQQHNQGYIPELRSILAAHHTRLEYLELFQVALDLVPVNEPMPLLLHLDLNLVPTNEVFVFAPVPRLRSVVLNGAAALCVTLPWVQLTSLALRDISPNNFSSILLQTENLVHCELGVSWNTTNATFPDIPLLRLESLVVENTMYYSGGSLPGHMFIVPALLRLEIPEQILETSPIDFLRSLISKSGCNLQNVHLTGRKCVSEKDYLEAFPSISFSFHNPCLDEETENKSESALDSEEDFEADSAFNSDSDSYF
ncbi:hypothetical protein DFH06DRAFT_1191116 [Mycena polygramma]|nr:hypothetical protein DFH06DRAFT_1191116 [Mycena polygramma]